jgi:phosphoribosylformylglycinamidine synthase PurS subunit
MSTQKHTYKVELVVRPRTGVRDPQGDAVEEALRGVGYHALKVHCVGRFLRFDLQADSVEEAQTITDEMCKRLLVNPNLETYDVNIVE